MNPDKYWCFRIQTFAVVSGSETSINVGGGVLGIDSDKSLKNGDIALELVIITL